MRCEVDEHRHAANLTELLLDLRGMTVCGDAVGLHTLVYLTEEVCQLLAAACTTRTGQGIDDNAVGIDDAFLGQGIDTQEGNGGEAARIGNETRIRNLLPVQLRQAVNSFLQEFR